MNYKLIPDDSLLHLLKSSDETAFSEIYKRHWKKIYLSALKKTNSVEVAEELTQNIFVSLWERRELVSINQLEAYLTTAIKYSVINYLKQQLYQDAYAKHVKSSMVNKTDIADQRVLLRDLEQSLQQALTQLPEKTREVFKLSRFQGRSVKEIASFLKISEKGVEYHITQSLKLMRMQLKDYISLIWMYTAFFC